MAKEKDPTLSKDERKALKRAEKDKKRSDSDGVHKSKDKKEKKKDRAVLAEKVANAVESGAVVVVEEEGMEVAMKSDVEEEKERKVVVRPVGALVPFANPLADEKVAKKVFKGVKKGVCEFQFWCYATCSAVPSAQGPTHLVLPIFFTNSSFPCHSRSN
jgi:hypothetical protein